MKTEYECVGCKMTIELNSGMAGLPHVHCPKRGRWREVKKETEPAENSSAMEPGQ